MSSTNDLQKVLRKHWGYESFRPLQEKIIGSLTAHRDTCVVMPTGGGKSLCYQLPAAIFPSQTAIVISPLIALMADQVAQLTHMGIPAAFLNSTLAADEQRAVISKAQRGDYRLLYFSPERLVRDMFEWLGRVPISFFAIDEAHCISEWGHEFRPDYRNLKSLRQQFPDRPIAAFTASATRAVRHDIIEQLGLRNPDKYIASFHRPNLQYLVHECRQSTPEEVLPAILQRYPSGSVIVYSPTIKRVEQTVELLKQRGITAIPYHGKMEGTTRRKNQERWMRDEARVLVGTIAFGLGINKPTVRAVVHLSLPKSVEQYYQEAGRAGRDGLPADCFLLWQQRDGILLEHFIRQTEDPDEQQRAWKRYHAVCGFVRCRACRKRQICLHFGETPKWNSCGACDVCAGKIDWLEAPQTNGDAPAKTAKSPKRRSDGKRPARLAGKAATGAAPPGDRDAELFEVLREWRRGVAKERGAPAFTVLHDSMLDEISRVRPRTLAELRQIRGIGDKKLTLYGQQLLEVLRNGGKHGEARRD